MKSLIPSLAACVLVLGLLLGLPPLCIAFLAGGVLFAGVSQLVDAHLDEDLEPELDEDLEPELVKDLERGPLTEADVMTTLGLKPWADIAREMRARLSKSYGAEYDGIRGIGTTTYLIVQAIVAASKGGFVHVGQPRSDLGGKLLTNTREMAARCGINPATFIAIDSKPHQLDFQQPGAPFLWDGPGAALAYRARIESADPPMIVTTTPRPMDPS